MSEDLESPPSAPVNAPGAEDDVAVFREKLRLTLKKTMKTMKQLMSSPMGLVGVVILVFFGILAAFGPLIAPYPTPAPPGALSPIVEGKWMIPSKFLIPPPSAIKQIQWAIPLIGSLVGGLLVSMLFARARNDPEQASLRKEGFMASIAAVVLSAVMLAVVALDNFAGIEISHRPYLFSLVVAASAVAMLGPVLALRDDQPKSRNSVIAVIAAPIVAALPMVLGLTGQGLSLAVMGISLVPAILLIMAGGNMRTVTKKRAMKLAALKDSPKDFRAEAMALTGAVLAACLGAAIVVSGLVGYLSNIWTMHWMGTDSFGWDIYSELFFGAQTSVIVGIFSALIASVLGALVGLYSGYVGGWPDEIIMRINDVILSIPWLVLMIVIAGAISASTGGQGINLTTIILIIGVTGWSATARMVRAQVLSIRERQYIERAKAIGSGDLAIIRRHVLPNAFPLVFANTILTVAVSILSEATLSFLGLRPIGVVTWGTMLSYAQADNAFAIGLQAWEIMPGLCIVIIVLGFTLLGYALDDILNPKLRKR
jgi:peptide/nickel transport system permease protein